MRSEKTLCAGVRRELACAGCVTGCLSPVHLGSNLYATPGRYCGVSYLVFSEVKALERRTEAAEKAMATWKVCLGWLASVHSSKGGVGGYTLSVRAGRTLPCV